MSSGRSLYLSTKPLKLRFGTDANVPKIAIMRAECLNSGVERSIAASKMNVGSMLNAALACADAQMNLYIVGRSGAYLRIVIKTSSGRRLNESTINAFTDTCLFLCVEGFIELDRGRAPSQVVSDASPVVVVPRCWC